MFYIIEKQDQLDQLHIGEDTFIHIIATNENYHPALQNISLIYVRWIKGHKGYILCVNHSESLSLSITDILDKLSKVNNLYTLDKKAVLHHFPTLSPQLIDVQLINSYQHYQEINIEQYESKVETDFKRKYYTEAPSTLIPIAKHYEKYENIYDHIEQTINKISEDLEPYAFLNHYIAPLFYNIEKQGIKLSKEPFIEHFKTLPNPKFSVSKGKIYTQYNLYTLTGRPSNAFNGVNFAALNKTNGERAAFIPENDTLVEIDFKAYHPTIIAKLAGYEFTGNIYEQLSLQFPGSTPETIKELVFQQLYGGVRKDFQDKPFFSDVNRYTNKLWNEELIGIGTQFGKRFTKEMIENPTPQKLLNYIVQNTETVFNVVQFSAVVNLLKDKKTKIILYTYDSILLDYDSSENLLDSITSLLKFNYSTKSGHNYAEIE
jgi:hypothetical protein